MANAGMPHSLQRAATDRDLLPVVDESDRVIGIAPRREIHLNKLLHRAVHVGVFDAQGRLWLQKRSRDKDTFGGYWDLSATGHVDLDESYDEAAKRELREELGLELEPRYVTKIGASERTGWEFHALYRVDRPVGSITPNADEIEAMRAFSVDEIRRMIVDADVGGPVTPAVADALGWLFAEQSNSDEAVGSANDDTE